MPSTETCTRCPLGGTRYLVGEGGVGGGGVPCCEELGVEVRLGTGGATPTSGVVVITAGGGGASTPPRGGVGGGDIPMASVSSEPLSRSTGTEEVSEFSAGVASGGVLAGGRVVAAVGGVVAIEEVAAEF